MALLLYRWAHLSVSIKASLQRDLPLVPVYLLQVLTPPPALRLTEIIRAKAEVELKCLGLVYKVATNHMDLYC